MEILITDPDAGPDPYRDTGACSLFITPRKVIFSSLFVCFLATLRKNVWTDLHEIFTEGLHKRVILAGDPDHRLDTGIVFRILHYWEIWKVVSTDCAARRCTAGHALAGIAIAAMTSLCHRPTTDSHDRHLLAEVCAVRLSNHHYATIGCNAASWIGPVSYIRISLCYFCFRWQGICCLQIYNRLI